MGLSFVGRLLGILLLLYGFALLPPVLISILYSDGQVISFLDTLEVMGLLGLLFYLPNRHCKTKLRTRDGFLLVTIFWTTISLLGSLPFMLCLGLSPAEGFFESASAFTTTGATVLSDLDQMPHSLLFYRQELQWLGGIGVVVAAIALLPVLGIGGMQLYKAETAGPMKDEKLTPRITQTVKVIWQIYVLMTGLCTLLYWVAGMDLFDALAHSLATVSTGGFSTHDASMAYFNSPALESIAILFMLLGSISFNVHFLVLHRGGITNYWRSVEVRVFLLITLAITVVVALTLYLQHSKESLIEAWRFAAFETVSVISSTGFGTDDFSLWPTLLPVLLILISFIGGCAGSTSGGMKVIRFILLFKQAVLELERLVHPKLVRHVKFEGKVMAEGITSAVWGFFAAYVAVFCLFMLLLMADGMDQTSAFGAVAACMNNLGPGLGKVASSFAGVHGFSQWLMGGAMLMGRLEIFTILVLFSPAFWRK